MKLFSKGHDGGPHSGVTAYFLIEWKGLFSIALLRFKEGSRENFHSHAFHAVTWWLKGIVREEKVNGYTRVYRAGWRPKLTLRSNCHQVVAITEAWALTFRGPWADTWREVTLSGEVITLTHGRRIVSHG